MEPITGIRKRLVPKHIRRAFNIALCPRLAAGFAGGVVVDYPNSSKAKKYYLVLYTGTPSRKPASWSVRRALLTPQVNAGSLLSLWSEHLRAVGGPQ